MKQPIKIYLADSAENDGYVNVITEDAALITVKKGTKKGIYKVRVTIAASGNGSYNSGQSTVNVTVRVK